MKTSIKGVIAIDGYSACGKSTLARRMAKALGYRYIDTGAMYRAVTHYFQENDVSLDDPTAVEEALKQIRIDFRPEDNHVLLNGRDVETEIRSLKVSGMVSPVAAISAVRRALVAQQREMGRQGRVILDGRDIGTVVFPDAETKLFVTADLATRTDRRVAELRAAGREVTAAAVRANLLERDRIDSSREDSPLRQAEDAVLLDNSDLSMEAFVERGLEIAQGNA